MPAYLWGIETLELWQFLFWLILLPAYLWGIETPWKFKCDLDLRHCQPTYEELKLEWVPGWALVKFKYCQPTYEELKLFFLTATTAPFPSLPAYLWGIETSYISFSFHFFLKLPAYLWGIETGLKTKNKDFICKIASLPMRNWNFTTKSPVLGPFQLPAYLWGIETTLNPFYRDSYYRIASLPMRNWNLDRRGIPALPRQIASLPMRNWNFPESLAATLKISGIASLPMRNWNKIKRAWRKIWRNDCQPTYEELKPFCFSSSSRIASKLPAYLWGIETGISPGLGARKIKLPAYLWGIETKPNKSISEWKNWIASLPMRNWNEEQKKIYVFGSTHCQPTYEELKPEPGLTSGKSADDCQPTYEELKHHSLYQPAVEISKLPAYLWGIETQLALRYQQCRYQLPAYLWGIETIVPTSR